MKTASAALVSLLNAAGGANPLVQFDLYTFNLVNGGQLLYTTAPFPITAPDATIWNAPNINGGTLWYSGITWQPKILDPTESRPTAHWKVGLDSDNWQCAILPRPFDLITGAAWPDTIGGLPWLQAAAAGILDYADVIISRAYFAAMPTWPIPVAGLPPVGTITIFRGIVGEVDITTSGAYLTINDYKSLLTQQAPTNVYQSGCRHRVFDSRCGLAAASYTGSGSAGAGSTRTTILTGISAPSGSGTWQLGTVSMTSGLNAGFSRLVSSWDGSTTLTLLNPMPFAIATGDTFTITAGCDKTQATCNLFGNINNFGGEPYIPAPELSLG